MRVLQYSMMRARKKIRAPLDFSVLPRLQVVLCDTSTGSLQYRQSNKELYSPENGLKHTGTVHSERVTPRLETLRLI